MILELTKESFESKLFCDFIERWPTLMQVKRARTTTLTTFFRAGHTRNPALLETRLASIRSSQHLTLDEAVIAPNELHALMLVGMLKVILDAIKTYDQTIAELAPNTMIMICLVRYQVQDHRLHHVYWWPLASREIDSRMQLSYRSTRALLQ
jgi:hypothetical protein